MARQSQTSTARVKLWKKEPKSTSKQWRISRKCGANGLKWKSVKSMPISALGFINILISFKNRNYDEAIRVMQRAAAIPKNTKINYHDHVCNSLASLYSMYETYPNTVSSCPSATI